MSNDHRLEQLEDWLKNQLSLPPFQIEVASADASFRRYFRVISEQQTWIAMDAPPEKENCEPFVHIATMIEASGVQAPHIYHWNQEQGFMLISDLGTRDYLDLLDKVSADAMYQDAMDSIIKMQPLQNHLPSYNDTLLHNEMNLFRDWYLGTHLHIQLTPQQQEILDQGFALLAQNALAQPCVFVHRDFHSRNLMLTDTDNPGVIDFQDAVMGPITYDLVSLLKDCYIAWPRHKVINWLNYFLQHNPLTKNIDVEQFVHWFDLMGVQRHLKATGIFARLNYRDGKPGYLDDIPRTLTYIIDACSRYEELQDFLDLLHQLDINADQKILEMIQ
ncbi:MAG: phosphotransferase [Gammaproteobacteria bacterium]|nr:phosphotransferase [Gammaproteobacteria bacterium]